VQNVIEFLLTDFNAQYPAATLSPRGDVKKYADQKIKKAKMREKKISPPSKLRKPKIKIARA